MLDWIRERLKADEIRQQERVTAYIDGQLSRAERDQLEREMRADSALRREVDGLRLLKSEVNRLPQQRVPRNFTLDPALYGKPAPARTVDAYGTLRVATAFAAVVFIFMLSLSLFSPTFNSPSFGDSDTIAMSEPMVAEDAAPESFDLAAEAPSESAASVRQAPALTVVAETVEEEPAADAEIAERSVAVEEQTAAEIASEAVAADADEEAGDDAGADAEVADEPIVLESEPPAAKDGEDADMALLAVPTDEAAAVSVLADEPAADTVDVAAAEQETIAQDTVPQETGGQVAYGVPLRTVLTIGVGVIFLLLLAATLLARRNREF